MNLSVMKVWETNALQVMFSMGEEVSEEKAVEKIREADLDGDGRVNYSSIHKSYDILR